MLADRLKKVTGARIYARDHRAGDMKGWPEKTLHACLLRAVHVDRPVVGVDRPLVQRLGPALQVVTADELRRDGLSNPPREDSKFGRVMVVPGERAEMYGQPVALLVFEKARDLVRFFEDGQWRDVIRYGAAEPGAPGPREYDRYHLIRYPETGERKAGPDPEASFSLMKNGPHDPTRPGDVNRLALEAQRRIERELEEGGEGGEPWRSLERTFRTPAADPMFMEPEAGLGWWDQAHHRLHLVLGTQSPGKDASGAKGLWPARERDRLEVVLTACPPGGGFGGRDESSFPIYLALAARYAGGPVRLAYDRAEQFLSGIKRHASVVKNRLAYTPDGALRALRSEVTLDGGGQKNLTIPVLQLAVLHAAGPYRLPRTALLGTASVSPSAPAGSMRGFGIPQVAFAIESMIDEVATGLGQCPVEYRKGRMLRAGDRDVTGMTLEHDLGNQRLCDEVLAQRLWRDRHADKARLDREGVAYGVGFACCMEAYGTNLDAGFGGVELSRSGKLSVCSSAIDMGQGAAPALARGTAGLLGREAEEVTLGDLTLFGCLELVTRPADAPLYTPKESNSMSASMTAFFHLHAVEEACRVIFEHGLLPAARRLCPRVPAAATWRWDAGCLVAKGSRRLTLEELAGEAYRAGGVVGARVHAVFQNAFAAASFPGVDGGGRTRPIDGLAVKRGSGGYQPAARAGPPSYANAEVRQYKRTLYASVGHVLAVEVYLRSGRIQVVEAVTVLDAGAVHHRELLEGQAQGGLAMGLGMALTEELPPFTPETAECWNLNRYAVPRVTHVPPPERLRLVLVEPGPSGEAPRRKGIAEAAMTTVTPALANAVAHATGVRLCQAPFTEPRVLEALAARRGVAWATH